METCKVQGTVNYSSKQYTDPNAFLIALVQKLQTTIDIEELIQLFAQELCIYFNFTAYSFSNEQLNITINSGKTQGHQATYNLDLNENHLGCFTVYRQTMFDNNEIEQLELFLSALVYPLQNAIIYYKAIQSALTDPLTQIGNRNALNQNLNREIEFAKRHNMPLSVLMLDVDEFKQVNDTYGHVIGDKVLRQVTQCCVRSIRNVDMVFRYGGEEFIILLSNTPRTGAILTAERIRNCIAEQIIENDDLSLKVTASIGIAEFKKFKDNSDSLIQRADQALYQAKHDGRNCVRGM